MDKKKGIVKSQGATSKGFALFPAAHKKASLPSALFQGQLRSADWTDIAFLLFYIMKTVQTQRHLLKNYITKVWNDALCLVQVAYEKQTLPNLSHRNDLFCSLT